MQADVGFGDLIHPGAVQAESPTLHKLTAPSLRTYTPETMIAEKSQAMVGLGSLNSRMKNFYDIWRMSRAIRHSACISFLLHFFHILIDSLKYHHLSGQFLDSN